MATQLDLALRLLAAAENDQLMAKSVLPVQGVTDAGVGMLTQQAVEKAVKAVLAANEIEFPFTHNLEHLCRLGEDAGIELPPTLEGVENLTPFALAERYGSEAPIALDRAQALGWVGAAIAWARSNIEAKQAEQEGRSGEPATEPDR